MSQHAQQIIKKDSVRTETHFDVTAPILMGHNVPFLLGHNPF